MQIWQILDIFQGRDERVSAGEDIAVLERTEPRALAQAPGRMELPLIRTREGWWNGLRGKIRSLVWGVVKLEWLDNQVALVARRRISSAGVEAQGRGQNVTVES